MPSQCTSNMISRIIKRARQFHSYILVKVDAARLGNRISAHPFLSISYALIAFAVLIIGLLVFAQVDRVVVGQGMVITSDPKYAVKPFNKSEIRSINVKVGQIVKKGDVLIVLDPTTSDADVRKKAEKFESYQAKVAKIESQMSGKRFDSSKRNFDDWKLQRDSFEAERLQFSHKCKEYDEKIARLRDYHLELVQKESIINEQIVVAANVFEMWDELVNKNDFGSKTSYYKAKSDLLQLRGQLSETRAESSKAVHEKESTISEKLAFIKEWESKRLDDLATTRRDMRETQQELVKAESENKEFIVKAEEDAVILEVADIAVGSVVTPDTAMIKMISLASPLSIEAKISAQDIAHVAVGQEADIKLDTLPFTRFGQLVGRVSTVSRDSFSSGETASSSQSKNDSNGEKKGNSGATYYLARIDIVRSEIRNAPKSFRLIPGLSVNVDIKVGRRPLIEYLLFPIQRGLNEALREP